MKRENSNKTIKRLTVGALLIVVVLLSLTMLQGQKNPQQLSLKSYAEKIIADCSDSNHRPSCYDKEIPKLMDKISMEDAFEVTRVVQDLDSEYAYCHVLGHKLSALEIAKDPSGWKDVLARCPTGVCSNGCLHGGLQEKFRGEYLTEDQLKGVISDFKILCEKRPGFNPTGLEQGSCYHALGHLTMYATNADIDRSIELCDIASKKDDGRDYRQLCYDGVFMQLFQPLEPEDFALVKGKTPEVSSVDAFCSQYQDIPKASCHSESWPLYGQELISDPNALISFCSKADEKYEDRCYDALFYVLTTQFNLDSYKVSEYCNQILTERRGDCFSNAASRMIETDSRNIDKAIDLCKMSNDLSVKDACYKSVVYYSDFIFHKNSPEFLSLCNALPQELREECLSKS